MNQSFLHNKLVERKKNNDNDVDDDGYNDDG